MTADEAPPSPATASADSAEGDRWGPGVDKLYRELFRIAKPGGEYDKISLLACRQQGVSPDMLLAPALRDFAQPGVSEAKQQLRYDAACRRRTALAGLVEQERHKLLLRLFAKSQGRLRASRRARGAGGTAEAAAQVVAEAAKQQQQQQQQGSGNGGSEVSVPLSPGGGSAPPTQDVTTPTTNTPAAGAGASPRRHTAASPAAAAGGSAAELEMFRARELRMLAKERRRMRECRRIRAEQDAKDERGRQWRAQREAEVRREVRDHQELWQQRLLSARQRRGKERAETIYRQEVSEIVRQQREQRHHSQQERLLCAKHDEAEYKLQKAAERAALVRDQLEIRCAMKGDELEQRLRLHGERRRLLALRRDKKREHARIRYIQKSIAIAEAAELREFADEQWKADLLRCHLDADVRVAEQREELWQRVEDKKTEAQRTRERLAENRAQGIVRGEERINALLTRQLNKEAYLTRLGQDRSEELDLRAERKQLKFDGVRINQLRLWRRHEQQHLLLQARLQAEAAQEEEKRREHHAELHRAQLRQKQTLAAKEAMRKEIASGSQADTPDGDALAPHWGSPTAGSVPQPALLTAPPSDTPVECGGRPERPTERVRSAGPVKPPGAPPPRRPPSASPAARQDSTLSQTPQRHSSAQAVRQLFDTIARGDPDLHGGGGSTPTGSRASPGSSPTQTTGTPSAPATARTAGRAAHGGGAASAPPAPAPLLGGGPPPGDPFSETYGRDPRRPRPRTAKAR